MKTADKIGHLLNVREKIIDVYRGENHRGWVIEVARIELDMVLDALKQEHEREIKQGVTGG